MVSIVIPSRDRPVQLMTSLMNLRKSAPNAEVIVVTDIPMECGILVDRDLTAIQKWNIGAAAAHGEWIVGGSDDIIWLHGWLETALATTNKGFIGLNDGHAGLFAPFGMATREWLIKYNGGVLAIPHYKSWYTDLETCARAERSTGFVVTDRQVIEHMHPDWGTAQDDETYRMGSQWHEQDRLTYESRKAAGFLDDFEGVIK